MKYFYIFLINYYFFGLANIQAQVIISPTATAQPFFTLDQVLHIQLMNAGELPLEGVLQVHLENQASKTIFQMQSLPILLKKGKILPAQQIEWENGLRLGQDRIAQLFASRRGPPIGQYIYCYRFLDNQTKQVLGNYCQEATFQPFQKPRLIYPLNLQKIDTRLPILSWHPPLPLYSPQISYALKLVELEQGQSSIEAININLPLIDRFRIKNLSIPYPPSGIPLVQEKNYAWQVTAYWSDVEIGKTEIWEFSLNQPILEKVPIVDEAFRRVKRKLDGAQYEFFQKIYLAYDNRTYDDFLNFRIYDQNAKVIYHSQQSTAIKLRPGINEIILISKKLGLKKGKIYILEILDSKGRKHFLNFKYAKRK